MPWEEVEPIEQIGPPCETCRPDLYPENVLAMEVFSRCGDEWITAGEIGMKIAISGPSIESAMNVTGVSKPRDRQVIFDQVKLISRAVAKAIHEETMKGRKEING